MTSSPTPAYLCHLFSHLAAGELNHYQGPRCILQQHVAARPGRCFLCFLQNHKRFSASKIQITSCPQTQWSTSLLHKTVCLAC